MITVSYSNCMSSISEFVSLTWKVSSNNRHILNCWPVTNLFKTYVSMWDYQLPFMSPRVPPAVPRIIFPVIFLQFAFAQLLLHKNNSYRFRIFNCIRNLIEFIQRFSSSILSSRKSETVCYLFCWLHAAISGAKGSRPNSLSNIIILRTNLWCRYGAHDICESMKSWYSSFRVIFYFCQMINSRFKT